MSTRLQVLLLEDQPPDAELALAHLEHAGFDPRWQRVESVLADYQLSP